MIIRLAYSMSRKVQKLTTAENASDSSQSESSLVGTNSYSKMSFKNKHRCLTFKTTAISLKGICACKWKCCHNISMNSPLFELIWDLLE